MLPRIRKVSDKITLSSDFDFLSSYAHSVRRIAVVPPQISQGRSAPHLSRSVPRYILMYFSLNSRFRRELQPFQITETYIRKARTIETIT